MLQSASYSDKFGII